MSRYPKVKSGDPLSFPAALQNDLIDLLGAGQAGNGLSPGLIGSAAQGVVVNVKNTSGSDRARWENMSLSTTLRFTLGTDGKESVIFNAVAGDAAKPPAILQQPIASNKYGRALIFGYTLARVAAGSATTFAAKPNASHKLTPDAAGSVRLLAAPNAGAESVIPVIVGFGASSAFYIYELEADMATNSTTASIYPIQVPFLGAGLIESGATLLNTLGLASHQVDGGKGICVANGSDYAVLIPECEPEEFGTGGPL
jgi:hypothetical protein